MDTTNKGVCAVVEYGYVAKESDELDLVKGAIINSIKQMPGGWWEGTLQATGKTGMFPDNFVRILDTNNEESSVILRDKSATSNRRCKVIYSYTQVNDDELSLAVGDVIEFLGEVEEGWWRGRLKNKTGVFPSNFVIAIEPSPILASKRPPTTIGAPTTTTIKTSAAAPVPATSSTSSTSAITTSGVSAKKMNRLSFHNSKEDLLSSSPKNTSLNETVAAPSLPPKPQREYCRVEFPYAPQNDDELELKTGDIITIISMELPDKGWWKGESRGKIGVFPDNFVKLLSASEVASNEAQQQLQPQQSSKLSKASSTSNAASTVVNSTTNLASSTSQISTTTSSSAVNSKVFVKKSGSTSSTQSSNRKDSFGSRDSLNDILSETGLPTGNVATQRKSLENKNLDLTNAPDATNRLGLKKLNSTTVNHNYSNISTTTNTLAMSSTTSTSNNNNITSVSSTTSELRKSLENIDEKPPVLSKKPSVPTKKGSSVSSVAGNLLSGFKQKVKNVENKLTTAASQDSADGVGSSKMSPGLPEAGPTGNVVMRRAATIAVEDTDFDRVERASILSDMRAGRVKAPKRRPPSAAINVIGESNNNNSVYLNGSSNSAGVGADDTFDDSNKMASSDDNSIDEDQPLLAKPKPREWEKKKAPWMEELKASQVKKKTSPTVEPRSIIDRTSKNMDESTRSAKNLMSSSATVSTTSSSSTTKVQSSSVSSSIVQQTVNSEQQNEQMANILKTSNIITTSSTSASSSTNNEATTLDDARTRPNSLSLRNRSVSPSVNTANSSTSSRNSLIKSSASPAAAVLPEVATATSTSYSNSVTSASNSAAKSNFLNNHSENNHAAKPQPQSNSESCRVLELEKRVEKLEALVNTHQQTINDLIRSLREENDRVKLLRGELDKYAQCVTQV